MSTVHRHLRTLRCPSDAPEEGRCRWDAPCDLLGASHRIEAVWSANELSATRVIVDPQTSPDPLESWSLRLVCDNDRWQLASFRGAAFAEMERPTLTSVLRFARDEIKRLDVGAVVSAATAGRRRAHP